MLAILDGQEYFNLTSNGLSVGEVADKYNVSPRKVEYDINKYKAHTASYSSNEVYRVLYDKCSKLYTNGEISKSTFMNAYRALKNNGFHSIKDIKDGESLIKYSGLRGLSGKTLMLVVKVFFSEKDIKVIDAYNKLCANEEDTRREYIESKKSALAISFINHGQDESSKYSKVATYMNEAISILKDDKEKLERFYQQLAALGTKDSRTIIRFILSNL